VQFAPDGAIAWADGDAAPQDASDRQFFVLRDGAPCNHEEHEGHEG
jgi:hypothetical protein